MSGWPAAATQGALLQGGQLAKATVDTGAEMKLANANRRSPGWTNRRSKVPNWWPGHRRLVTRVDLNRHRHENSSEASMRADQRADGARPSQVVSVIAILAIMAVIAVVGFVRANTERDRAQASARQAIASRLVNEAAGHAVPGQRRRRRASVPEAARRSRSSLATPPRVDCSTPSSSGPPPSRSSTPGARCARCGVQPGRAPAGHRRRATSTVRLWDADTGQPRRRAA